MTRACFYSRSAAAMVALSLSLQMTVAAPGDSRPPGARPPVDIPGRGPAALLTQFAGVGTWIVNNSDVVAISSDGLTVGGTVDGFDGPLCATCQPDYYHLGYRWSKNGGMQVMKEPWQPQLWPGATAVGMSSDSSVLLGRWFSDTNLGTLGVFWREPWGNLFPALEIVDFTDPLTRTYSLAFAGALSGDGLVAAGSIEYVDGPDYLTRAFRWEDGASAFLPDSADGLVPEDVNGADADGDTLVGRGAWGGNIVAFAWTANATLRLPDLSGGDESGTAFAVTPDGSEVAGVGTSGMGEFGIVWTLAGPGGSPQLEALETPTLVAGSEALAISSSGRYVGGSAIYQFGRFNYRRAVVWDRQGDLRTVESLLGPFLPDDWYLRRCTAVAEDATFVYLAGDGRNPENRDEGWWARVPKHLF